MPFIEPSECAKKIRAGNYERLYLFYGRDTGALDPFAKKLAYKLCPKDARIMNLHSFDAQELDLEALADSVQVLPMFAERVVVQLSGLNMDKLSKSQGDILRNIIADIPDTTTIIINAGGEEQYRNKRSLTDKNKRFADNCAKRGAVVEFAYKSVPETGRFIAAHLQREGCSINRQNAEYLAQMCLCETSHIMMEIAKLASYAPGKEITRQDIDLLCIRKVESDGFSLALNILNSNAYLVFKLLDELKAQNYASTQIAAIIGMSLTDIYRARLCRSEGKSWQDCAADFGYPKNREFAIKNAFSSCSNISIEKIRKTTVMLAELELRLKTVNMNEQAKFLEVEEFAAAAMAI